MNFHKSLLSFGDSFTYGTELQDCVTDYSNNTWPALCSQKLGLAYKCFAQGGVGNQFISTQVLEQYAQSRYKNRNFFVINWTWIERFDYIDADTNFWKTVHPQHDKLISHFYYRNIDSEIWNLIRNLQTIHSTIKFLESQDCDFFMTCIDDKIFCKDYPINFTALISTLQSIVRPYIQTIDDENFYSWSVNKKFPIGSGGHPLEQAHAAAAEHWLKKIKHQLHFADP